MEGDLKLVSEERAKSETRLRGLSARLRPALLAVSGAVLLSLLLGLYFGYRDPPPPSQGAVPGEPLKLRLEDSLRSRQQ